MPQLFSNDASAILATSTNIGSSAINLNPGQGNLFPVVVFGSGDFFMCTLEDVSGNSEICKCLRHDPGSDQLLVDRGEEGTSQKNFVAGSRCELRITKGTLENLLQKDGDTLDGGTY